jgi:hypothetical protein
MKRDDFIWNLQECAEESEIFRNFDQNLLDQVAAMFKEWGNRTDKEHLFKDFGLNDEVGDSDRIKREKKALRCISSKIMEIQINKDDVVGIMRNFNKIMEPGFRWLQ